MQLSNFAPGNDLNITQSNHGVLQAYMAFDFGIANLVAPANGVVERIYTGANAQSGFHFKVSNQFDILFHHAQANSAGYYRKGTPLGKTLTPPGGRHTHVAVNYQWGLVRRWGVVLDFMERSVNLLWYGKKQTKYVLWPTYSNLQVPGLTVTVQTTNTIPLRVRQQPNTRSLVVGYVQPKTRFVTTVKVQGESINGNTNWYGYGNGYISGAYCIEI